MFAEAYSYNKPSYLFMIGLKTFYIKSFLLFQFKGTLDTYQLIAEV